MSFKNRVEDLDFVKSLQTTTPARIGIGHAGGRYPTKSQLKFKEDLAISRDAVRREVPPELVERLKLISLCSRAKNRAEYLRNTRVGRFLNDESRALVKAKGMPGADIQLIVSEGLSSEAFEANVPEMLPLFLKRFKDAGVTVGPVFYTRWARVVIMDDIGEIVRPKASLILIGERPGLGISDSLSAYFEYEPRLSRVESDRNVLSNIHRRGVPPTEASLMLADAMLRILKEKKSGMTVRFEFA